MEDDLIRVLFEEGWIVCPSAVSVLSLRAHVHADPPASTALPTAVPDGGVQAAAGLFRVPFE